MGNNRTCIGCDYYDTCGDPERTTPCEGRKHTKGISDLLFWSNEDFIRVYEGSGQNLSEEDRENGNVDDMEYEILDYDCGAFTVIDGGLVLLTEYYQDKFQTADDVIHYLVETEFIPRGKYICLSAK